MTEAQARARLERMVAVSDVPELTATEVDDLVSLARRADRWGRGTSDEGWEPTYNLATAAAEGWRWKAGRVAGNYSFGADGGNFSRSEVYQHCLQMASHYSSLAGITSVQLSTWAPPVAPEVIP